MIIMELSKLDYRKRLLQRHPDNPILTAYKWPYFVNSVFNAGAIRLSSKETLLLCRVEDCSGMSHLCAARSSDGVNNWKVDPKPTLLPDVARYPDEKWGIEDPRIVWLSELKKYVITYTSYSSEGPSVSIALTKDFRKFEKLGSVMPPEDKDAALFPYRFKERWAMIHRPVPASGRAHIWISFSPDLIHWGDHKVIIRAKRGPWWDAYKIGLSPPPIETPEGWLLLYHGVRQTPAGCLYRIGLALLDLKNPIRCLLRSNKWIMGPETDYERTGDVGDVVFPCGYTLGDDGDTIHLYYGAADTSVSLVTGSIREMLAWLKENSSLDTEENSL
ncbi:MAG: glycosidase [Planctomycetota bacterium]|nr:MAG: glycosidase [Planctomycetota bacterium]